MTLLLRAGPWRAELRPEAGGALAALRRGAIDVLRPMPRATADPLRAACFPLVPFCNRIRDGRFAFEGRTITLPANFPPERHAIHGFGWQNPWRIVASDPHAALLRYDIAGTSAWPWACRAEQRIALDPDGCSIELSLTNRSTEPMPAGLGLHPYFRRRAGVRLQFACDHLLPVDAELLPTGGRAPADSFAAWHRGASLPDRLVDHCHAGWRGTLVLDDDCGRIRMTATGAPHLHLFAPPAGDALACEPVSHTPDALNRAPEEMIVLAPGDTAVLTMRISAEAP